MLPSASTTPAVHKSSAAFPTVIKRDCGPRRPWRNQEITACDPVFPATLVPLGSTESQKMLLNGRPWRSSHLSVILRRDTAGPAV